MSDKSTTPDSFDRSKTLEQLEQEDWGEPTFDSHLVRECHRLRRVPVAAFRVEDLRIMIGQQIGLIRLVPLALEKLEGDPLAEGNYYAGDLLNAVVQLPRTFWDGRGEWLRRLSAVIGRAEQWAASADADDAKLVRTILAEATAKGLIPRAARRDNS
jgi:contact-dependent growth inhibition (CDI) system CdiI-like immunity protein